MIRFTTPAIPLTIEGKDLSTGEDIIVTFKQGNLKLEKSGADLDIETDTHGQVTDTIVTVILSQAETGAFIDNKSVEVQVNWINASGARDATEIAHISSGRNLLDEVISYGN